MKTMLEGLARKWREHSDDNAAYGELLRAGKAVAYAECADELEAALAALAGAAPVAWISAKQLDSLTKMPPQLSANPRNVHLSRQHTRNRRTPLYTTAPHAPAKAREVTEADVERALRAPYGDGDVSDMLRGGGDEETAIMRAALATFAEGEE